MMIEEKTMFLTLVRIQELDARMFCCDADGRGEKGARELGVRKLRRG